MKIQTPCIVIDYDVLIKNIENMSRLCAKHGPRLRPHIKTHKMTRIAEEQIKAGAAGVTVATLSEAEIMAESGIDDIFIAYPLVGEDNVRRAIRLAQSVRLIVSVESVEAARALSQAALKEGIRLEARLEIDTGLRRSGILYDRAEDMAVEINKLEGLILQGLYTHRGLILDGKVSTDREKCGVQEGQLLVDLANRLRQRGIDIVDVSPGSSLTAEFSVQVEGVTEVRPGTYVFNDMMQIGSGTCQMEDIAATIYTTIVSVNQPDAIVVDCGSKAISTDVARGTAPYFLKGYAKVIGHDDLTFERMSEEHGILIKTGAAEYKVGDVLRLVPNHICPTINLYDDVYIQKGGKIIKKWRVDARARR